MPPKYREEKKMLTLGTENVVTFFRWCAEKCEAYKIVFENMCIEWIHMRWTAHSVLYIHESGKFFFFRQKALIYPTNRKLTAHQFAWNFSLFICCITDNVEISLLREWVKANSILLIFGHRINFQLARHFQIFHLIFFFCSFRLEFCK